jgi:small subunit ribosomal protein S17e
MGRIKTKQIKRLGFQLMRERGDVLKEDFNENKKLVEQFLKGPSKKMRNCIAGYVSRLVKRKEEY